MNTRNWSQYQQAIFSFIENGVGNAVVQAVAGSGKSTTIVECMNRIPAGKTSIFLAFNKAIAEELKERGVNARTFHSLTYSPVMQTRKARNIEAAKLRNVFENKVSGDEAHLYTSFVTRMVGLGRQAGVGCLVVDTAQVWIDLADHHEIELENENAEFGRAIELCSKLLSWSNADPRVDFDDLLYFAVKDGLSLAKFDFVFIDEAQDTNAIQRAILRKIIKPTSRIVAVGDKAQAIYGFRGADSDSLDMIADEFDCKRLPLTVSYRCPQTVVNYAKQYCPEIEASATAPAGDVVSMGMKWALTDLQPNDLLVCRTTRPLISLAYRFLKNKIRARIMGREIGQGLKALVTKMNAKGINALVAKLEGWETRETERALAKRQDARAESISDKAQALFCLIGELPETERTIPALLGVIDSLFADSKDAIVLATIHKAKGLEANRVFWLNSSQCPAKWAKNDWQQQQEMNLCYVAITRAKKALFLIEE